MSTISGWDSSEVIKIPFPQTKFDEYLKRAEHNGDKPLFPHFTRLIFQMAYDDFKSGALSLDDFSSIGGRLWNHEGNRDDKLSNVLLCAAELNFYVRNIHLDDYGDFPWFMGEIVKYFEENK
jgi:hypothetical protein